MNFLQISIIIVLLELVVVIFIGRKILNEPKVIVLVPNSAESSEDAQNIIKKFLGDDIELVEVSANENGIDRQNSDE